LIVQAGEGFGTVFVPRQKVQSPGLFVRGIGADECGGSQIEERAATEQPEPLAELRTVAGGKLCLVRGGENAAAQCKCSSPKGIAN
jgi:hypothetical protein